MDEYVFHRLDKSRIRDLYLLFLSSGKRGVSYSKFEKKYDTHFANKNCIGYLAYDHQNNPAAFYGVLPTLANIDSKDIVIAQSADTLTHPNHQRRGLFIRLAKATYELAQNEGIHFLYGIPNELSFPGFIKKLNWIYSGNLRKYEIRVPNLPISYLLRKTNFTNNLHQWWIKVIISFYSKAKHPFDNPNVNELNFGITRRKEYFDYKSYMPKYFIKINDVPIWFSVDGALKVGDMKYIESTKIRRLISKLKIIAFLSGTNKIQFQFSPNSKYSSLLEDFVLSTDGLPIIYLNLSNEYDPNKLALSMADIDTF